MQPWLIVFRRWGRRLLAVSRTSACRDPCFDAAWSEADLGPVTSALVRFEAGRCAVTMLNLEATTQALAVARRAQERAAGRRPGARAIERLQRRQALQDQSCSQALAALRELAGERRREPTLGQYLERRYGPHSQSGLEIDAAR